MSDIIPVIVHHETGEKPQTGGKKNQEYLRYCIAQAKKYNEKVVLLGDQYNKDWCDDWHDARQMEGIPQCFQKPLPLSTGMGGRHFPAFLSHSGIS